MSDMRKTVLITGASGGLGLALARVFAREGYDLVLVARRKGKLTALRDELAAAHGARAEVLAVDLSMRDAALAVTAFTEERKIAVDILVNNAGFGDFGPFAASDWTKQYRMVELNIAALMQLSRFYLPAMAARGGGKILNVASIAAFQPGPLMSVYYASKAFVLSFSEALSVELASSGVTVTALCPGPTRTGFEERARLGDSGLFKHMHVSDVEEVAEYGYRALLRGKVVAVAGFSNKVVTVLSKFAPRAAVRWAVYRIQK